MKHSLSIIEDNAGMNSVLCWDCNIINFFIFSAKMWAEKVGRVCTMQEARTLHYKFLCCDHFLPTDFTTPGGICLNRTAVPLGLDSASHSIPQSSPPMLPTLSNPQPSAVCPQSSNLPVLPPLQLTSELTEEKIAFKSCHPWEPIASCVCQPLLRLLFLSTWTVRPLPLESLYQILHKQQPTYFLWKISPCPWA